jgi:hypothetical protein
MYGYLGPILYPVLSDCYIRGQLGGLGDGPLWIQASKLCLVPYKSPCNPIIQWIWFQQHSFPGSFGGVTYYRRNALCGVVGRFPIVAAQLEDLSEFRLHCVTLHSLIVTLSSSMLFSV